MIVKIYLIGCDDETCFEVETNQEGLNLIKELSEKSNNESDYACMPILEYTVLKGESLC